MKYRVAICDDERICLEQNAKIVSVALDELNIGYSIDVFATGEDLINALLKQERKFDLLLLDVELPGISGIELGKELRKRAIQISIIVISGFDDYVFEGYEIRAVQYLVKPVDEEKLKRIVQEEYERNFLPSFLTFYKKYELMRVEKRNILYLEACYNITKVLLIGGEEIEISTRLKTLKEQLSSYQFAFCHKSYCVNLQYVIEIRKGEVQLLEGKAVPISKGFLTSFRQAFLKY